MAVVVAVWWWWGGCGGVQHNATPYTHTSSYLPRRVLRRSTFRATFSNSRRRARFLAEGEWWSGVVVVMVEVEVRGG